MRDIMDDQAKRAVELLAKLLPYAQSHAEDWSTGLEDGTYDDELGLAELGAAIDQADELLTELGMTRQVLGAHPDELERQQAAAARRLRLVSLNTVPQIEGAQPIALGLVTLGAFINQNREDWTPDDLARLETLAGEGVPEPVLIGGGASPLIKVSLA